MGEDRSHIAFVLIFLLVLAVFGFVIFSVQEALRDFGIKLGDEWLIFKFLFAVIFVAVLVSLLFRITSLGGKTPLEKLRERYIKGEISKEELDSLSERLRAVK